MHAGRLGVARAAPLPPYNGIHWDAAQRASSGCPHGRAAYTQWAASRILVVHSILLRVEIQYNT